MKTITECQPLIYGLLMAQAEQRKVRRRKTARMLKAIVPVCYVMLGLALVFDAGIVPWDLRFWLIFCPFFLLGEWVLATVAQPVRNSGAQMVREQRRRMEMAAARTPVRSENTGEAKKAVAPRTSRVVFSGQREMSVAHRGELVLAER